MRRASIALLLAASALAACTVGPNYHEPKLATPAAFAEAQTAAPASEADLSTWWKSLGDPELDTLIDRALAANLDLQTAASRVRQARRQVDAAAGAELPTLNATGAAVRLKRSGGSSSSQAAGGQATGGQAGAGAQAASGGLQIPSDLTFYSAGFDASWELDLFGKTRRTVEAARDSLDAAVWQARDGQVSLTAELAGDYVQLRGLQARIAIARDELARQSQIRGVAADRARFGFTTSLDVEQQNTQVAATAAALPQLEAQARALVYGMAVLLGEQPETLSAELERAAAPPASDPTLPAVGLPSDLLRRRPDVRMAERKLAAATAQVGVAVADLYPQVNLMALGSRGATSLGDLIPHGSNTAIGLAQITWPVFNAGRTRAQIDIAREDRQQAYLAYQKAVLAALADAETAIARYRADQDRLNSLTEGVAAAQRGETLARQQYGAGLSPFVNVLQTQGALLNARDQLTSGQAQARKDLASLYKALGGGWRET